MGGYAKHNPTVYVVEWPDGIVKVGYTEKQRWRKFVIQGASIIDLYTFNDHRHAFSLEQAAHEWMRSHGTEAFDSTADAEAHLGHGGGGFRECFRLDSDSDSQALLKHMLKHMLEHSSVEGGE